MADLQNRIIFQYKASNAAAIAVTALLCIQDKENAKRKKALPHNALVMANQSTSCTLFVYLDDPIVSTTPDYVLFPNQQVALDLNDGVGYDQIWVKNTSASVEVAIGELSWNITTVRQVSITQV